MKLQVIIGSVRQGRVSDKVGKWVSLEAGLLEDTEVETVDLKDYVLPMFDEPVSPQYNPDRQPVPEVKRFLDKLAEADAYAIVTPEYNRSYSSVLKNALDFIDFQLVEKPVALIAHGSTGGAQAVSHLRGVLAGLKTFTTPTATYIAGRAGELIDDSGKIVDEEILSNPYGPQGALKATLTELKWYSDALSAARIQDK
ncbi:MAG TPA: NAD(P)H-dependent oxidoreductase [Candidatus Saccharimonadales bacterium]|nr:NAD(P)H-dependent oxidoreductase [Candidatus Saccharimonadales bacterium]